MSDTPDAVQAMYERMVLSRTVEERVRMGARMHEASRRLVWAGLRAQHPDADDATLRALFLERFYGAELGPAATAAVLAWHERGGA